MPRYLAPVEVKEQTAPGTPVAGIVTIYAKSDHKLYTKDSAGAEIDLTAGGGKTYTDRTFARANFR